MKKKLFIGGAVVLFVLAIAGCSLFTTTDLIVGSWQQVSINGSTPGLVTIVDFTDTTYTVSTAAVTPYAGTWTKSGSTYTLTGAFFGFISTTSTITPANSSFRVF